MNDKILQLSKRLIAIDSTAANQAMLSEAMNLVLSELQGYKIERFEKNGVQSALIYNSKKRPREFKVLLSGHLDVIPGKSIQLTPRVAGGRLYGLGALDMKASVACLVQLFTELAKKVDYPLALQLVTDEEEGGLDGAKYQIEEGVRAKLVIAAEPTDLDIVNEAKGVLQLKIIAPGKPAHGAYPWRGDNAIWRMHEFLNELKKLFPPMTTERWVTTANLSRIETSNQAINKIPGDCMIWLDIRFTKADTKKVLPAIRKLLPSDFKLVILTRHEAMHTDASDEGIKLLEAVAAKVTGEKTDIRRAYGTSDGRYFAAVGCPAIEFGPSGRGMGEDREWVSIKSLNQYYEILRQFLISS